jgi:hypothetical protein
MVLVYGWLVLQGHIPDALADYIADIITRLVPEFHAKAKEAMKEAGYCVQFNLDFILGTYKIFTYKSAHGPVESKGPHKGRFLYYCSGKWIKKRKMHPDPA